MTEFLMDLKEDRAISFIRNAEDELSELCGQGLDSELKKQIHFVDSLINCNESTKQEVLEEIQTFKTDYNLIFKCIEYVLGIRPKQAESLLFILSKMSETCEYKPSSIMFREFGEILTKMGFIDKSEVNESPNVSLTEEKHKSIKQAIIDDDVNKFINYSSSPNFDTRKGLIENKHKFTYMQVMAFYGSVKCFKYALIDGTYNTKNLEKYAIAGGNTEIIHLLEQNGAVFDDCFNISVKYHRNSISDWLLNNYICKRISLDSTLECYNIRAFLFICANNLYVNDMDGNFALCTAIKMHNLQAFKFLVDVCKVDINKKLKGGRTILHMAAEANNTELIKYLVQHHADLRARTLFNRTTLNICISNNNFPLVKYLVEECQEQFDENDISIASDEIIDYFNLRERKEYIIQKLKSEYQSKRFGIFAKVEDFRK